MAGPGNAPDRAAMMKILLPAGAVAAVVVVVAVLWSMSGAGMSMSDGSNGTEDDPGLVPVMDGVRYRDINVGSGNTVAHGETVRVRYKGWLTDGFVFDSSESYETSLSGVVKGWSEGIPGMRIGGVRKLVIAPEMAYGGVAKNKIPPNSTLIFEVTLIEIKPAPPAARPARKPPTALSDGTSPGDDDPKLIEVQPGLKYRDIKEGNGTPARENATVTIDYAGWLLNGKMFDSSWPQSTATTMPLVKFISGWQIGIPGMKPGGIRKLVIAPDLAYKNDRKGDIPPGATLVFEVELIEAKGP